MTLKAFYWKYSLWAAILNTASIVIYLSSRHYENAWWLYIGNLLFSAMVLVGVFRGYHRVHDERKSVRKNSRFQKAIMFRISTEEMYYFVMELLLFPGKYLFLA